MKTVNQIIRAAGYRPLYGKEIIWYGDRMATLAGLRNERPLLFRIPPFIGNIVRVGIRASVARRDFSLWNDGAKIYLLRRIGQPKDPETRLLY